MEAQQAGEWRRGGGGRAEDRDKQPTWSLGQCARGPSWDTSGPCHTRGAPGRGAWHLFSYCTLSGHACRGGSWSSERASDVLKVTQPGVGGGRTHTPVSLSWTVAGAGSRCQEGCPSAERGLDTPGPSHLTPPPRLPSPPQLIKGLAVRHGPAGHNSHCAKVWGPRGRMTMAP